MLMHHHTKFDYKKLKGSEGTVWILHAQMGHTHTHKKKTVAIKRVTLQQTEKKSRQGEIKEEDGVRGLPCVDAAGRRKAGGRCSTWPPLWQTWWQNLSPAPPTATSTRPLQPQSASRTATLMAENKAITSPKMFHYFTNTFMQFCWCPLLKMTRWNICILKRL